MDYQGKRKDQVEYSEKVVFYSVVFTLVLLLILLITK